MARPGRIIAIGGGKGGVGKSIIAISIGTENACSGKRVVLADLDLGAANFHTYLGIFDKTPSLADFILGDVSRIEDVIIDTSVKNLRLISGSRFVPGMANPAHWTKLKIMRHLKTIDTDVLIIDLGAGVHYNTLDFFCPLRPRNSGHYARARSSYECLWVPKGIIIQEDSGNCQETPPIIILYLNFYHLPRDGPIPQPYQR